MTREEMLDELRGFVVRELLDGRDTDGDEHGVEHRERFGIEVPQSEVAPQNLKDLDSYVGLLMRLR